MTFNLGGGLFGLGTIASALVLDNDTSGSPLVNLAAFLTDAGLTSNSPFESTGESFPVYFRSSSDPNLTASINNGTTFAWLTIGTPGNVPNNARFSLSLNTMATGSAYQGYANYLNAATAANGEVLVTPGSTYSVGNGSVLNNFYNQSGWRFLAKDAATDGLGAIFSASCIISSTNYGLWCSGEIGDRSGYFSRIQGCFSIVILRNGSTWYFSVFTPVAENSTSRNDSVLRSPNITPAPGQTGDDRFSELFLFRDQGNGFSEPIGKVPGLIYVDMNKAANAALVVGDLLEITPGIGTSYPLTNKGAIVVAQWGLDISATVSNVGEVFTIATASTPTNGSLSSGNRSRTTLENNQRIRFTATPPTGLATATDYWVRDWDPQAFTFKLSATEGGAAIVPTSDTSSTITRFAGLIAMPCYQAE